MCLRCRLTICRAARSHTCSRLLYSSTTRIHRNTRIRLGKLRSTTRRETTAGCYGRMSYTRCFHPRLATYNRRMLRRLSGHAASILPGRGDFRGEACPEPSLRKTPWVPAGATSSIHGTGRHLLSNKRALRQRDHRRLSCSVAALGNDVQAGRKVVMRVSSPYPGRTFNERGAGRSRLLS